MNEIGSAADGVWVGGLESVVVAKVHPFTLMPAS